MNNYLNRLADSLLYNLDISDDPDLCLDLTRPDPQPGEIKQWIVEILKLAQGLERDRLIQIVEAERNYYAGSVISEPLLDKLLTKMRAV